MRRRGGSAPADAPADAPAAEGDARARRLNALCNDAVAIMLAGTDGEGLGKFKSGDVNPLQLDIKFDKKGLMAAEETKRGREVVTMTACKDLSGKHIWLLSVCGTS